MVRLLLSAAGLLWLRLVPLLARYRSRGASADATASCCSCGPPGELVVGFHQHSSHDGDQAWRMRD